MASSKCVSFLSIFALVISCVLIILGIVGIAVGPEILQNQISNQLPLSAYSDQLDSWEIPPVPIYLQFWLWECVNVLEVLRGAKPAIIQQGPFTYLEHRQKIGVAFNENHTVSYRQQISYTFLRNMSLDDEQLITMVNAPLVTIISLIRTQSKITQEIINFVTKIFNESLFVQHTAREWIWGYEDLLLKEARKIPILQDLIPDDHFGYFYGQNATDDGLYTVFTGETNIDLLNTINKWNGISYLPYWKTSFANQINGTDGSWFAPLFKKELQSERLYVYSTDICRSIYAKFEDHSSVLNIETEKFSVPGEVFLNASINPDNAAFGSSDSGVLNVSACRQGAPIFLSLPHLLYAADQYQKRVLGIAPDPNIHRTLFDIEPHTGLVLNAKKRLQVNVYMKSDPFIDDFKNISEVILPVIWLNESITIDQKSADSLNNQVLRYFTIVRWVSISLIPLGIIVFIVIMVLYAKQRSPYGSSTLLIAGEARNSIAEPDD